MGTGSSGFPTTRWSCVLALDDADEAIRCRALSELLSAYRPALLHFLVAIKRIPLEQAEDYVQAFIEERILRGSLLDQARSDRGRLRSLLLRSFSNFITDQHRKMSAGKRTPAYGPPISLDEAPESALAINEQTLEMDAAWARQTLAIAINAFRLECLENGRSAWWDVFESRLLAPIMGEGNALTLEALSARHGFGKPQDAANALVSAKRAFGRSLRIVIAETISETSDVDEELRALISALSRGRKEAHD